MYQGLANDALAAQGLDWLRYSNQGATRNRSLSPQLLDALKFLPELGLSMEVFSGGQAAAGSGGPRTGSTRHDHGNAADVFFYKDGRRLDWGNPDDVPLFQEVVRRGRAAGITGFGAGEGYMQPGSMHIGFGNPAVWGAGGSGANAPAWLREAYGAAPAGAPASGPVQGLLSTKDAPMTPPEQQRGLLFGLLGPKAQEFLTPERVARAQMALEGMTLNPNQGVMEAAKATLGESADRKNRNKTAEWLAKNGRPDLAEGVMSGAVPAGDALRVAMTPPADNSTAMQKNYEFFRGMGMSHEDALKSVQGGTNISVNTGPTGVDYGKPGDGLVWQRDGQGNIVMDDRGAPIAIPYQGGPADLAQKKLEAEQIAQEAMDAVKTERQEVKASSVSRNVDKAIALMDKKGPFDIIPEAGVWGQRAAALGNQEARDLGNTLASIQAAVSFDTLQQMREASKTGGALGSVSERELDLLMSAYGALQQDTSPALLRENLLVIKEIMGKIENDPVASRYIGGSAPSAPDVPEDYRKYVPGAN